MQKYKIIFESGVVETIEVEEMDLNTHIGSVVIKDADGEEINNFYLDLESISAVIPMN